MKILTYLDSYERYNFFKKFHLIKNNIIFITNIFSVYIQAKKDKFKICLIKKTKKQDIDINHINTLDFKSNWLNSKQIRCNYNSSYYLTKKLHSKFTFKYFFIWNGERSINLALGDFARENNIKTLFFEISNLPNKIFVDKFGVTAKSSLAFDKNILNKYLVNESDYIEWKKNFLESKFKKHEVGQLKVVKSINKKYIIDWCGFVFLNLPRNENSSIFRKIKAKILANKHVFEYDTFDLKNKKYIFFPLQVSTDSQVLINSNIDNIEAIKKSAEVAKKMSLTLLVKPHPAETDIKYIKKLENLKKKYNFYFVNYNTFHLINHAIKIITINSTVGIESMILQKNIKTLGESYYKNFNQKHLQKYIMSYLIKIDYFNDASIPTRTINNILLRA